MTSPPKFDWSIILEKISLHVPSHVLTIIVSHIGGPNGPGINILDNSKSKWYSSIDVKTHTTTTGNIYFDVIFNNDKNKLKEVPVYLNAIASGDSGIDKYTVEQTVGVSTRTFTVKGYTITGDQLSVSQFILNVKGFS